MGYNVLAYNPATTYTPWRGGSYTDRTISTALYDPTLDDDATIRLDTANTDAHSDRHEIPNKIDMTRPPFDNDDDVRDLFVPRDRRLSTADQDLEASAMNTNPKAAVYGVWVDTDGDGRYDEEECPVAAGTGADRPFADRVHPPWRLTTPETPGFVSVDSMTTEQQRNFANWYTYYRSPELILKRAMSEVVETTTSYVGMSTLNSRNAGRNGQSVQLVNVGIPVRDMAVQTNKNAVLNNLFSISSSGSTPLRSALFGVGQYFDQTNSNDSARLGFNAPSPILSQATGGECQKNFAVLMTDGLWNGVLSGVGNTDGDDNSDL